METNIKNKILITGCAGLVGSANCHWILENTNDDIIGVDNLTGGFQENLPDESSRFIFHKMDVENESLRDIFIKHSPTHVMAYSAYAAECLSPFIRKYNITNNLLAMANLINCCINYDIKRILFTSSIAVYGHGKFFPPFYESLQPEPIDPYGCAKYFVEMDLKIANEQHGLDYVILRPHNIYSGKINTKYNKNGYGQVYNDRYRNFLAILMYRYLRGEKLTIFGDGLQKRAFSYIGDSLPCFYRALTEPQCSKQIINIGGIQETTILDAANVVIDVIGGGELIHLEQRHEVKNAYPSYQKSVELLGFEHKTNLYSGVTEMWDWVKKDYELYKREPITFGDYEVNKGMYSYWKNRSTTPRLKP